VTAIARPVAVGLVGAGQWARTMHAPLHAAGQETRLTGIWSPSNRSAQELAAQYSVPAFASFEDLLESCEAVDFAVPPAAQGELAIHAARAGKALMLEKPLAASLSEAERVVEAVTDSQVATIVVLTKRFHPHTVAFLDECRRLRRLSNPVAVTGRYVHGGFLASGFLDSQARGGWREDLGALFDLGPHLFDLADAVAGQIIRVRATGDPREAVLVTTQHAGGAEGQLLLSGRVATPHPLTDVDLYGPAGHAHYTTRGMDHDEIWPRVRAEFASAVLHGTPVTTDVHRALHLQRIVEAADSSLAQGGALIAL
jgi:predicted dehydrogenase